VSATDVELIARIVIAAFIGTVLGLEREAAGHEPGIRTHALVAVGAAVFTVAGAYGFDDVAGRRLADPARVAAQVATGIGFVGAGAVLRSGATVRGLTTATTLWVSAAVGVAAGAGLYVPLVATGLIAILVLVGLRRLKPHLLRRFGGVHRRVSVEYQRGFGTIGPLFRQLEEVRCRVGRLHIEDEGGDGALHHGGIRRVTVAVQVTDERALAAAVGALERRAEVVSISVDALDD
jgi:putative Mg2+ transporter-C (MgtC) family protein